MGKTIEQRVADTVLQRDIATINIGGETYNIAPPTLATLILVSEIISTLPVIEKIVASTKKREQEKIFSSVMHNARFFRPLGDIAAVLILGAKGITERITTTEKMPFLFGLAHRKVKVERIIDRKAELAKKVLENVSPTALFELLINQIRMLELGDFFAITTSLTEANILKPTREVED